MSPMMEDSPIDTDQDGFMLLQNGHRDMIEATAFNAYGDRFASSSVDGKIKVYNRHRDGSWNLCDTFGAHMAEILEIQWAPPSLHPSLLAALSTDGKFKLFTEDPTLPPQKGRRFTSHSSKPIFELRSPSRSPYLSFSLTHNPTTRHTYLILINRAGVMVLWENDTPESLDSWNEIDRVNVHPKPARGEETAFKVQFDPNPEPCYEAIRQGVPRDGLGVIVASMNSASIWRTKEVSHPVTLGAPGSGKEFYLAAEFQGHRGLVRDVAWASGGVRGFDIVATACKDGFVRVFEVRTTGLGGKRVGASASSEDESLGRNRSLSRPHIHSHTHSYPQQQTEDPHSHTPNKTTQSHAASGITAGLASITHTHNSTTTTTNNNNNNRTEQEVPHTTHLVSKLDNNKTPVWRVEFDADGLLLASTGDDGKLRLWRREPSGRWSKSCELGMVMGVGR